MNTSVRSVQFLLAKILDQREITVQQLSKKTGISTGAIGDLRTGKNSLPRKRTLEKLCAALNVEPGDLIKIA